MLAAARQVQADVAADWMRADEAAALCGQDVRTWQRKAMELASRGLARMQAPPEGGKPVWYVHRGVDARLNRFRKLSEIDQAERSALITRFPSHKVDAAYKRAHWLAAWRKLCETPLRPLRGEALTERELADRIVAQAKAVEGEGFAICFRSLQRWFQGHRALGDDGRIRGVEALIDNRGIHGQGGGAHEPRTPAAVEHFYGLYHCQSRISVKTSHVCTLREARKQGWTWPASYAATAKWLQTHDDLSLSCLMREGKDAWQRRYMPHVEIDYTRIEPGNLYVCDHHQADFWIAHEGAQLRPWLTAIQDGRSRCIVGWHLGVSPHQDSILAAMRRAFGQWAIPDVMRIDNGRDFTSKLLTGFTKKQRDRLRAEFGEKWRTRADLVDCGDNRFRGVIHELGIELIYAIPYAPYSKGTLERFFGTFEDQVGKSFATYCGNSTLTRPECLDTIRKGYTKAQRRDLRKRYGKDWLRVAALKFVDQSAVPSLEHARAAVGEWLEIYHREAHRGDGVIGTPLDTWNTAVRLNTAVKDQLLFLLQTRGVYKVGRNGVAFTVGNAKLSYGAGEPKLYRLRGRDVWVTLDPDDLSHCYAWSADRKTFIAKLASNERISPLATVDDLREANAAVQRRRKVSRTAEREAPARTRTAAEQLAASRRERLAELRATGTDAAGPRFSRPVTIGFGPGPATRAFVPPPSEYDALDLDALPAAEAPDRPRATLADLIGVPTPFTPSEYDDLDLDDLPSLRAAQ